MSITRDDLLTDPLMSSLSEEPKPALTLSELFSSERVVLGAIKSQISNAVDWMEKRHENVQESNDKKAHMPIALRKTEAAPRFEFEDPFKNILARNVWNQMECRLASGGYDINREADIKNIKFMLKMNMATYDKLPHKNFIGVQPMENQCQMIYHNEFSSFASSETRNIPQVQNSIETYAIEAKTKKLCASVRNDMFSEMDSLYRLDVEDELTEILAHEISGELYRDMVSTISNVAGTSTMTATSNTPPSTLDIMAAIHEASDEIRKNAAMDNRANWIIMSPQMAAILLNDNQQSLDTSNQKESPHASLIGNLHGMDVFMDTEGAVKANNILVGRKGNHAFSQGITYCPHTLAIDSSNIVHPTTFESIRTFVTRADYFTPNDAENYFQKIEFKEAPADLVGYKAGEAEMDAGYFYCPYIPLMTTNTDEDLMDIIMPFGVAEKKTIAELFTERKEI